MPFTGSFGASVRFEGLVVYTIQLRPSTFACTKISRRIERLSYSFFHASTADLFPQLCVLKASKYTRYIVGFQPSLVAKSLTGQNTTRTFHNF